MTEKEYREHIKSVVECHKEYLGETYYIEKSECPKRWLIKRYDREVFPTTHTLHTLEKAITIFMCLEPLHIETEEEDDG